ncbi:uncharacterized protein sb:cb288 isoform X1 [Oncorhynchus kisutch]|uniref:uncharacterized protein sb:cb288 isoform X1 n=1 Tax=Oncorhynchus kisutch TaxID=8019 RepID=UPI00099FFD1F|nr:uncharacterized protein LOC109896134 isoform X1 [Oncorhynchus kisutch]
MWTEVKNQTKIVFSDGNTSEVSVRQTHRRRINKNRELFQCTHGSSLHMNSAMSQRPSLVPHTQKTPRPEAVASSQEPLQLQYSLVSYWVSMQFCGSVWSHHPKGRRGG